MKEGPFQGGRESGSIELVTDDGMARVTEMSANLMPAPSADLDLERRRAAEPFEGKDDSSSSEDFLPAGIDSRCNNLDFAPPRNKRPVNLFEPRRVTFDQSIVDFERCGFPALATNLTEEIIEGSAPLGEQEDAAGRSVESMEKPGFSPNIPSVDQAGIPPDEGRGNRPDLVTTQRMTGYAGRLVDDEEIIVFVHDFDVEVWVGPWPPAIWGDKADDFDEVTSSKSLTLASSLPSDAHVPTLEHSFHGRPRRTAQRVNEKPIEPSSLVLWRDRERRPVFRGHMRSIQDRVTSDQ